MVSRSLKVRVITSLPSLSSPDPENIPSDDAVVNGKIILTLTKPKRLKSIRISVVQRYDLGFPDLQ